MIIEAILLINVSVLAYSVVRIRNIVKSMHNAFPNEALVRVHLINSFIYTLLWLILTLMSVLGATTKDSVSELTFDKLIFYQTTFYCIYDVFSLYMDCFLMYLIWRFTKQAPTAIGRMPFILFI